MPKSLCAPRDNISEHLVKGAKLQLMGPPNKMTLQINNKL